jgi:O-antigen/teichoic acid export membrane protein
MMTSQFATWVLATVSAFIIPRFLGPAALGDLRLAGSLWLIAGTIAALGTSRFLELEIARSPADGLASVGPTLVLRSLAFVVAAIGVGGYVAATGPTSRFATIVALAGAAAVVGLWSETLSAAFVGLERMSAAAVASVLNRLLYFVAVVGLLVLGGGVYGVLVAALATASAALVFLAIQFWRVAGLSLRTSVGEIRRIAMASRTFMAAGVALVLYQQVDMVVISWVAESEDLGWYGAADVLFGSLLFPATVLVGVMFPTMGRLYASDGEALNGLIARAFSLLMLAAVPIGLGTVVVAREFAPFLYGDDFAETGRVLEILGPVTILTFGTILFGATALATERGRIWVGVLLVSATATVPLDLLLVPWANDRYGNGAIGGAIAYLVTEAFQFVFGLVVVGRFLLTRPMLWRMARIGVAGAVMLVVGLWLRPAFLPLTVAACAAIYVLLVVALRVLNEDERRMVRGVLTRLGIAAR